MNIKFTSIGSSINRLNSQYLNTENDSVLLNALSKYIKNSNFPKNLLLKKFDLVIDKYNEKINKMELLLKKILKTNESMKKAIVATDSNNKSTISDLISKLS